MSGTSARPGQMSRQKLDLLIRRLGDKKKAAKKAEESIPRLQREMVPLRVPLSFSQQRLWLLDQLHPRMATYNIAGVIALRGELQVEALNRALSQLVERHEVLRTTFEFDVSSPNVGEGADGPGHGAVPMQVIAPPQPLTIAQVDLTSHPADTRAHEAAALADEEARRPFDLQAGPLLRTTLLRLSEGEHRLVVVLHHGISDGWSLGVYLRELAALYSAAVDGSPFPFEPLPVQFADVSQWQRQRLQGEALDKDLEYWRGQLDDVQVLELPTDRLRPAQPRFVGQRLPVSLRPDVATALKGWAQSRDVTLFMVLESAFAVLLARLSGQSDITVGMPVAGRRRKELEGLIGFFVNTVVLRHDLDRGQSFSELLRQTKDLVLGADAHQEIPFEKLVEELSPERQLATTPFFQSLMNFTGKALGGLEAGGLHWQPGEAATGTSKFDLSLDLADYDGVDAGGSIRGSLEFDLDLFDRSTVERWWRHLEVLLDGILADAETPWAELPWLSEGERQQLIVEWNGRKTPFPLEPTTIHDHVSLRARRHPDHLAVIDGAEGAGLTYGELEARANQLAHYLQSLDAGPEGIVGICMDRSVDMVVALLAILKSGAAYLPLDVVYPPERLAYMLEDSGAGWLLTSTELGARFAEFQGHVLVLDDASSQEALAAQPTTVPNHRVDGDNLAYAIYTSGSTGRPKGVLEPHRNVLRLVAACRDWFEYTPQDRWSFFHSHAFDFSIWEIWGALTTGGQLVVVPYWVSRSPEDFYRLLRDQRVTILSQTPSAFRPLIDVACGHSDDDLALRQIVFGGEALDLTVLQPWVDAFGDDEPQLINMYGITEITVHAAYRRVTAEDVAIPGRSPIGVAIPDLTIHLVDRCGQPQPIGIAGEMLVGGDGLARGYLGRPALTAEKFLPDPFSGEAGARLYRSGDLARFMADGDMDFLGRIDHQVKIRGFRIELGEVESALQALDAVAEAAVLVREILDAPQLVAYLVPVQSQEGGAAAVPAVAELRELLGRRLPDYMIPAFYVPMAALPLTANGKLDRRALPEPEIGRTGSPYVAPRTFVEATLCALWQETLGIERVGVNDEFFALGGHSLTATQVVVRIRQRLGLDVPLRDFFEAPTVAELAVVVEDLGRRATVTRPPLVARPPRETAALSFAQEGLWFLDQMSPGSVVYSIPALVKLQGSLDVAAFHAALQDLVDRHGALRTVFRTVDKGPRQLIVESLAVDLPVSDLRSLPSPEREEEAARLARREATRDFDLGAGPLLRARLLRLRDDEHHLILNMHHIVSDGWSVGIMLREWVAFYGAQLGIPGASPAALEVSYADYAEWQRDWLQGPVLESQLVYWRSHLRGAEPLELPTDRPRPAVPRHRGTTLPVHLDGELGEALQAAAKRHGATLYMVLLAAYGVLLSRLSGQTDLTVGSPVANRGQLEIEGLIGFFVNTLALRLDVGGRPSLDDLLPRVRDVALAADAHGDVPFEKVVAAVHGGRQQLSNPLLQTLLVLQNTPAAPTAPDGLRLDILPLDTGTSKFDLTLALGRSFVPGTGAAPDLHGTLEFDTDLFDRSTVERWWGHFRNLLQGMVAAPSTSLWQVPLLSAVEQHQLTVEWNSRQGRFPGPFDTLHAWVSHQATQAPDRLAIVALGSDEASTPSAATTQRLTFGELEARSNQLAHHFQSLGAGPEQLVGVCMERSVDLVVALLAILKSGAAYLPLDLAYPSERLSFMLEDSGAGWLISEEGLRSHLPQFAGRIINIDDGDLQSALTAHPTTPPESRAGADNLAYVIYTSGSTGRPKGVLIPHGNVTRLLQACDRWFSFGEDDRWSFFHSHAFDFSVWEIWGALATGGRLVVVPYWLSRSPEAFYDLLRDQGVTILNQTPSAFRQLVAVARHRPAADLSLREVIFGGEALDLTSLRPWFEHFGDQQPRLVNMYGITETTVHVTFRPLRSADVDDGGRSPVGEAIPDLALHILDGLGQPQPIGVAGEIQVGGDGLARGYLKRPALTAERFVPDPFSGEPGARLYRSGDLARYLADGDVDFIGRIDHQVKIRGFRIELGEIEACLQGLEAVTESAVLVRQILDEPQLVAYVVSAQELSVGEMRQHLAQDLPDYMVPAFLVTLDAMPLTANGKLDRRALPLPKVGATTTAYEAPRTRTEIALSEIWTEILGVEKVGLEDDFFALGGHSLLAAQVMVRLRQRMGLEVPLRHLFESSTIAGLATVIDGLWQDSAPPVPEMVRRHRTSAPLSFAQERLWFLDQLDPGNVTYNIPALVSLRGRLDVAAFRAALSAIVARHEVLRTVFRQVDGEARQIILDAIPLELPVEDLGHLAAADREAEASRLAFAEAATPFDLQQGPLLRARLVRLADDEHRLILNLHHIVSDGWSVGVLLHELVAHYGCELGALSTPLPELPVQYADFAHWQRQWLAGEVLERELDFWRRQLAGVPVLELPTDRPRPAVARQRGANLPVHLDAGLSQALKALAREQGVTLYMLLLAAYGSLLSRLTGQEDLTVGAPVANRGRLEIEGLIGFFVNTLVQRLDLSGAPTFEQLLRRTRDVALSSEAHQNAPFEKVVAASDEARQQSISPLFQTMLVLHNAPIDEAGLEGLQLELLPVDSGTSKFEMTWALGETVTTGKSVGAGQGLGSAPATAEGLRGVIEYDTDLFDRGTIERWWKHFETLLRGVVASPSKPLWQVPVLSPAERQQLVVEWNDAVPTLDALEAGADGASVVPDLFAAQVARTPSAPALRYRGAVWTYRELAARAWILARRLRDLGIGPDRVVGVCLDRRPDMIVAMLAAQAAGGAYVPLDPNYPRQRLAYILEDTAAPVVLTREALRDVLPDHPGTTLCLDDPSTPDLDSAAAMTPPPHGADRENLAHLIYTSGSTGRPKGVAIPHRSVIALLHWARRSFSADELAGMLAATSINFDLSVFEILVPLCWGGSVILAENALELPTLEDRDAVRLVNTVPSAMAELVRQRAIPASVRTVNLAGEPLRRALVDGIYDGSSATAVYNLYGPSEDTTYSTYTRVPAATADEPTIGRPVSATRAYVLNGHGEPVPLGAVGELYLGGEGLSRGYLGRTALTAASFVPDHLGSVPGGRLYRTGDRVRYLPSSELVFLGRVDHQVKIRGFRIELGEIESALLAEDGVRDAVVMVHQGPADDPRLVAYLTGDVPSTDSLRRSLGESLPEYMVPTVFVELPELPLLPNGKVHRKALPVPDWRGESAAYEGPRSATEEALVAIWQEVLGIERIGIHDNFFALGGHSLLAAQTVARLRHHVGDELPLRHLFEAPTVAQLAAIVDASQQSAAPVAPPLVAQPRGETSVLSFAQERLWFLDQLEPGSVAYNIPALVSLQGALDVPRFQRALEQIVERHEALRTVFRSVDGEPRQIILPPSRLDIPLQDLTGLPRSEAEEAASRRAAEEAATPFDLRQGPLLRARLLRLAEDDHRLIVNMHHIVSDGWSVGVLMAELMALYGGAPASAPSLSPLPVQYADFAQWQRGWLQGDVLDKELDYWRQQLNDVAVLELPTDRPRPAVAQHRGATLPVRLDGALSRRLVDLAQEHGVTLYMVLLAAYGTLLSRLTGQLDLTVGSPVANRRWVEIEGLIGFFVNTLVQRLDLGGSPTFGELLERTRDVALASDAHQDVPFEKVVAAVDSDRQSAASPLFQSMLVLQNAPSTDMALEGLRLDVLPVDSGTAKFDLTLALGEPTAFGEAASALDLGLQGSLEYDVDLFDRATILRWWGHFQTLLAAAVADVQAPVEQLPLLSAAEQRQLTVDWNGRAKTYPSAEATIHGWVTRRARQAPDHPAIVDDDGNALTYGELEARANRLAHHLVSLGAAPEQLIGVCMERSVDLVVAMLAVLKSGAAYLPLDLAYPTERLAFILEDSGARWLLSEESLGEQLPEFDGPVLFLDDPAVSQAVAAQPTVAPTPPTGGDHLAYVIYTSGSTGRPKGVLIPHDNVVRLMAACDDWFAFAAADRWTFFHSHAFDFSVWEIWGALITGGTLVVVPYWVSRSPEDFYGLLCRQEVTVLNQTPSAFRQLVEVARQRPEADHALRQVIFGGEALDLTTLQPWFERFGDQTPRLVNMYGITETTVHVTYRPLTAADAQQLGRSPVGEAIPDLTFHIADRLGQTQPIGVAGEILVGGAGLARGYHGRPALTAQRFVPDPFSEEPGARLYRSGDLARYRADGDVDFLGRIDHQVKIRGFRIELGEIEASLQAMDEVAEAAVLVQEVRGEPQLVAYWVAVADGAASTPPLDAAAIRQRLAQSLPDYMVPAFCLALESLPLTANGKLDRRALPAPEGTLTTAEYRAPSTPEARALGQAWEDILGVETVGLDDDFFALGGHSLLATKVVARMRQELQVEIPLRQIFEASTLERLAEVVSRLAAAPEAEGGPGSPTLSIDGDLGDSGLALSFAQERLWLLDRFEPGNAAYNMPVSLRLEGPVDVALLEASLAQLVRRHECLRTTYVDVDGQPVQNVGPAPSRTELPVEDLSSLPAEERRQAVDTWTRNDAEAPFDLAQGPVFRVRLLRLDEQLHVLLFNVHHIASDGWSMGLLTRDLGAIYGALAGGVPVKLPELPIRYVDYAQWQRQWLSGDVLDEQLSFWRQQLAELPVGLELPTDRPRPAVRSFTGDQRVLDLDGDLTHRLEDLARRHGGSLFMVLLATFEILLSRLSGQTDLAVGTPIAGRQHREVEDLVGIFLNSLVLRGDLTGNPTFETFLGRVRDTTLAAYAHQDLPFEKLLDELQPARDLARTPFFQVFFNMVNLSLEPLRLPGLVIEPSGMMEAASKFDLTVYVKEVEDAAGADSLRFEWVFNTRLFDGERIEEMLRQFHGLLRQVVAAPESTIDALDLCSDQAHALLPDPQEILDPTWRGAVHTLMSQRAAQHPDKIAVRDLGGGWTYRQLDEQSNRLAHWLIAAGVEKEDPVAILAHRGASLVWAVLGVLKSGGAFVLFDPAYPAAHLSKTLERARPKAWLELADAIALPPETEAELQAWGCPRLTLPAWQDIDDGAASGALAEQPSTAVGVDVTADDLAYISFTSGSTGIPKGILGRHGPLTHFLPWQSEQFELSADDRYSMLSGLAHDPLQRDMFTPLCLGATVCIPEQRRMFTAGYLAQWMRREQITIAHMTPAMAQVLTEPPAGGEAQPLEDLRYAFLTGDVLTQRDVVRLRRLAPKIHCVNFYGSTETQRAVGFQEAPAELGRDAKQIMPLGRGMRDVQLLVVNPAGHLAGIGELGEVVVRSPHLARGYLGDPELSADRFIANPLRDPRAPADDRDRAYRTGDLGRYQVDGSVAFAGRADHQVKIRGFRIELGEIEGQLAAVPGVREAVVQVRGAQSRSSSRRLLAMIVRDPTSDLEVKAATLRDAMRQRLPEYMVPAGFVFLDSLPLTPNGKLDRRALAQIEDSDREIQMAFKAPRTEMEKALADILKEVLEIDKVGADDNFFDLGGNSLLLVKFHNRIQQIVDREVQAVDIFNHPTVASFAAYLTSTDDGSAPVEKKVVDRSEQLKSGRSRLKSRLAKRRRP